MSTEPGTPKPSGSDEPNIGPYRDAKLRRPRERWSIAAIGSAIGAVVGLGAIVAAPLSAKFSAAESRPTVLVGLVTFGIVCLAFSVVIAKTVDEELNQVPNQDEFASEIVRGRRLVRATLTIGKTLGLLALVALALVLVGVFLLFLTCLGR